MSRQLTIGFLAATAAAIATAWTGQHALSAPPPPPVDPPPRTAPTTPVTVPDDPADPDAEAWEDFDADGRRTIGASASADAIVRASEGTTEDEPVLTVGDGDGAPSACHWEPLGPLAEIAVAQAAINAGQAPDLADPTVGGVVANVPAMITPTGGVTTWYQVTGTTAQVRAWEVCNGVRTRLDWLDLVPDGSGGLAVRVSAYDLVPGVYAQVVRNLPTPVLRVGPADEDDDGFTYVNMPTFFWLDVGQGQWGVVSGTASAGGITVTVQAVPVRLVVDPGDGSEPVRCEQFRPVLRRDVASGTDLADITDGCSHRYVDSSSMAPNGQTWPVTGSIVWHATWSATNGEGGELGYLTTTSPVRDLPVAEIQAVIVDSHPD